MSDLMTHSRLLNVNPGLINPWLINRGGPLIVGIQTTVGGNTPLNSGTGCMKPGSPLAGSNRTKPAASLGMRFRPRLGGLLEEVAHGLGRRGGTEPETWAQR